MNIYGNPMMSVGRFPWEFSGPAQKKMPRSSLLAMALSLMDPDMSPPVQTMHPFTAAFPGIPGARTQGGAVPSTTPHLYPGTTTYPGSTTYPGEYQA